MRAAILTRRIDGLQQLCSGLVAGGFRIDPFSEPWSLLKTPRSTQWTLVVLDGTDLDYRPVVEELTLRDAATPVAVLTSQPQDDFHATSEGLGILQSLPTEPTLADVPPLLERLRHIGALDPRVEAAQQRLDRMVREHHPHCLVCWDRHPFGLKVDFRATGEHTVEGTFPCGQSYQGYPNIIHGGIVSSLLDGAMAHCILAMGLKAYTVDLRVRFRSAVETGVPATITGTWVRHEGPLHLLAATLVQEGRTKATARAKFFEGHPDQPSQPLPRSAALRGLLSQARRRAL